MSEGEGRPPTRAPGLPPGDKSVSVNAGALAPGRPWTVTALLPGLQETARGTRFEASDGQGQGSALSVASSGAPRPPAPPQTRQHTRLHRLLRGGGRSPGLSVPLPDGDAPHGELLPHHRNGKSADTPRRRHGESTDLKPRGEMEDFLANHQLPPKPHQWAEPGPRGQRCTAGAPGRLLPGSAFLGLRTLHSQKTAQRPRLILKQPWCLG